MKNNSEFEREIEYRNLNEIQSDSFSSFGSDALLRGSLSVAAADLLVHMLQILQHVYFWRWRPTWPAARLLYDSFETG